MAGERHGRGMLYVNRPLVSVIFTPASEIQGTEGSLKTQYSRSSVTRFVGVGTRKNTVRGGELLLITFNRFRRISEAVAKSVRRLRKFVLTCDPRYVERMTHDKVTLSVLRVPAVYLTASHTQAAAERTQL